ncbi:MAG: hypothetical protein AABZ47_10640, partial [Planctomycetota bacterium]
MFHYLGLALFVPALLYAGGNNGTDCWNPGDPLIGPDLIIGQLVDVSNYVSSDGIDAFAISPETCNIGSNGVMWTAGTNQHPVYGQGMFRLKNGRMEQIGQSWLFHEFTALPENKCGCGCSGGGGNSLPAGCSDVHCCGITGSQAPLGPKFDVNAFTGVFPYPPLDPPYSGSIARRIQVHISDVDPAQNGGGLYFVEGQYIAPDDSAAGNQNNNASYRRITITGSGTNWIGSMTGLSPTIRTKPAIRAWKDNDPEVTETDVQIPGEGLLILAAKATQLSEQLWQYEYAVQNLNSHRSVGSFRVPLPECATAENIGFHDVDYHSGEPFDGTDWPASVENGSITWSTTLYVENPDANALRWGTLYNFRFDSNMPPGSGNVTLDLFRPGNPAAVTCSTVVPVQIPFGDIAPGGGNGIVDLDDLQCILAAFGNLFDCPPADLFPC